MGPASGSNSLGSDIKGFGSCVRTQFSQVWPSNPIRLGPLSCQGLRFLNIIICIINIVFCIIIKSINIKNIIICVVNIIIFIIINSITIKKIIICIIHIIIFIIINIINKMTQFSWVSHQDSRVIGPASEPNSLGSGVRAKGNGFSVRTQGVWVLRGIQCSWVRQ